MSKLNFKFKERAKNGDRNRVVQQLLKEGADHVQPLFPDDSDPELAALFTANVHQGAAEKILKILKDLDAVEFAEGEVRRRLIRPK